MPNMAQIAVTILKTYLKLFYPYFLDVFSSNLFFLRLHFPHKDFLLCSSVPIKRHVRTFIFLEHPCGPKQFFSRFLSRAMAQNYKQQKEQQNITAVRLKSHGLRIVCWYIYKHSIYFPLVSVVSGLANTWLLTVFEMPEQQVDSPPFNKCTVGANLFCFFEKKVK